MNHYSLTDKVRLNLTIQGRRTSLALESGIWDSLTEICRREELSLDELCDAIVRDSNGVSMASAIRIGALRYFLDNGASARGAAAV